ncbi:hypothetical protein OKW43_008526 [Paraburkholderia sp. WC7.3g]
MSGGKQFHVFCSVKTQSIAFNISRGCLRFFPKRLASSNRKRSTIRAQSASLSGINADILCTHLFLPRAAIPFRQILIASSGSFFRIACVQWTTPKSTRALSSGVNLSAAIGIVEKSSASGAFRRLRPRTWSDTQLASEPCCGCVMATFRRLRAKNSVPPLPLPLVEDIVGSRGSDFHRCRRIVSSEMADSRVRISFWVKRGASACSLIFRRVIRVARVSPRSRCHDEFVLRETPPAPDACSLFYLSSTVTKLRA